MDRSTVHSPLGADQPEWHPFPIRNGTRQGCPLSPLLLEPLLQAIRSDPSIHGIQVGDQHHKVAAYADDLLFFVRQPLISLSSLTFLLRIYSSISNYKINMAKSEILGITVPQSLRTQLQASFPFRWCHTAIKYLGVYLTPDLYPKNFLPLLQKISADLAAWALPHVTWFGRISVLKMNILPRVLYLLQTLPIVVPSLFFSSLQKLFYSYVWNGRHPRLKLALLTAPKSAGGLALPNVRRYYQAVHLLRILEWSSDPSQKLWIPLESALAGGPLASLPWLTGTDSHQRAPSHPTISATLRVWQTLQRTTLIAPWPSPVTTRPFAGFLTPAHTYHLSGRYATNPGLAFH